MSNKHAWREDTNYHKIKRYIFEPLLPQLSDILEDNRYDNVDESVIFLKDLIDEIKTRKFAGTIKKVFMYLAPKILDGGGTPRPRKKDARRL